MRACLTITLCFTLVLGIACSRGSSPPPAGNDSPPPGSSTPTRQQTQPTAIATQPVATASGAASASGPAITESDVRKIAEAWAAARSYRIKVQGTSSANGQPIDGVMEFVKPDRSHIKLSSGGQTFEVIRIGTDTYTNIGGRWLKSPVANTAPSQNANIDPDKVVQDFTANKDNADLPRKGGVITVDGVQCQEWVAKEGTFCIGTRDSLPRRFVPASGDITLIFTDWNASITISPPI